MSKIVVLDNEWVTLWYHADTNIVHHQIHRFIYGDQFRIHAHLMRRTTAGLRDERGP